MSSSTAPDVFLLSAGLGKRLRPLTEKIPKPLIPVAGKSLIERHLERLSAGGFRRVAINLHYLPEKIREFAGDGSRWGLEIFYSEEPVLLDTGGGVKNIEGWIQSAELVVINSDSLFDDTLDLAQLIAKHRSAGAAMTLLVGSEPGEYTNLWVERAGQLTGFGGKSGPEGCRAVKYLGTMVLAKRLFATFAPRGTPFSLTSDVIPNLLQKTGPRQNAGAGGGNNRIETVEFKGFWDDIGTPERLAGASKHFKESEAERKKV